MPPEIAQEQAVEDRNRMLLLKSEVRSLKSAP
jgi:hypothetical protein